MGAERLTNGIAFSVPRIGGYNPDYQVGSANLSGGRRYRLRGRINGAYRIGVGVYTLEPNGKIAIDDYRVLNARAAELDAEGRFDLRIDPDSTAEQGLRLKPTSNLLLIREIRLKPGVLGPARSRRQPNMSRAA